MDEFGFIAEHLSGLAGPEGLNLKDDAALWQPPAGLDAVMTMDTQVEGVHFPQGLFEARTAEKLIAVNISDLVAKGSNPLGYLLSLSVSKKTNMDALVDFCRGLSTAQNKYGVQLWGGDMTRTPGPTTLSITMIGTVPKGKMVLRSGAKPGDVLCVTGNIGDSVLGLKALLKQIDTEKFTPKTWLDTYHAPKPPFALRQAIRTYASAALDVSDGLVADAGHMARASSVGLDIMLAAIPLSSASAKWVDAQPDLQNAKLTLATGGDDYQVLMSVPKQRIRGLKNQAALAGIKLTTIGEVTDGTGVECLDDHGKIIPVAKPGYTHF